MVLSHGLMNKRGHNFWITESHFWIPGWIRVLVIPPHSNNTRQPTQPQNKNPQCSVTRQHRTYPEAFYCVWVATAAVIECCCTLAVMTTELSSLTVLRLKVPIKASAERFLLRAVREGSVPGLRPCLGDGCFLLCAHVVFPVYVSLCSSSCFLQNTPILLIRDHPNEWPYFISGTWCYEWNVSIPLKFICWNPVSSVIILGGGTLGSD